MAVKFSKASAAVCSSMFSSWHSVSRLLRTELSSIRPVSESDDSSPRIRSDLRSQFQPSIKTSRVQSCTPKHHTTGGLPLTIPTMQRVGAKTAGKRPITGEGSVSCLPNPLLLLSCFFQASRYQATALKKQKQKKNCLHDCLWSNRQENSLPLTWHLNISPHEQQKQ